MRCDRGVYSWRCFCDALSFSHSAMVSFLLPTRQKITPIPSTSTLTSLPLLLHRIYITPTPCHPQYTVETPTSFVVSYNPRAKKGMKHLEMLERGWSSATLYQHFLLFPRFHSRKSYHITAVSYSNFILLQSRSAASTDSSISRQQWYRTATAWNDSSILRQQHLLAIFTNARIPRAPTRHALYCLTHHTQPRSQYISTITAVLAN